MTKDGRNKLPIRTGAKKEPREAPKFCVSIMTWLSPAPHSRMTTGLESAPGLVGIP